jgi:hypothetical protein
MNSYDKNKFTNFLKKNKIRRSFITNYYRDQANRGRGKSYRKFLNQTFYDEIVDRAFFWEDTSEGRSFWRTIEKSWLNET